MLLQIQNATIDWPVALATAVCLLFVCFLSMSVFVVTLRRRVRRLQREFKRLSEDVNGFQVVEQRRFLQELKATKKPRAAKKLKDAKKEADPTSMAAVGDLGGEVLRLVAGKEANSTPQ